MIMYFTVFRKEIGEWVGRNTFPTFREAKVYVDQCLEKEIGPAEYCVKAAFRTENWAMIETFEKK